MDWIKGIKLDKVGEKLVDRTFSIFETELSRFTTVEEQLNRLQSTLTTIHALLTDAEDRRHITDKLVINWLRELSSVAFDSDDLLDSHRTALAVHRLRSESSRKRKWNSFEFPSLSPEWGPFHRRRIALQIETIDKNLDIISKKRDTIRLRSDDGAMRQVPNQGIAYSQRGSSHDPAQVSGRETELNEIVTKLTADSGEGSRSVRTVPVVAIHGAAGIGKTTLARMIFDDSTVHTYFDLKVWVDLTDQSDVISVTKVIYEKMTRRRCDRERLDEIQEDIRGYLGRLTKKKVLIVLDNFWEEGFQFWEDLRVPLLAGEEGSKVLITTRNESICRKMLSIMHSFNLPGLGMRQCQDLFCSFAFPVGVERNERLVKISKEIAERCCGSPLAAKTLGALLNGQKEEEWQHVLHELRVLPKDINGTSSSLLVSYHHLPYPIKKCFAYCCIFPSGYLFEKDQLIRYWLAEGLIPYEGRRRLEHVGTKFFDELKWRSFFEKNLTNEKSKGEKYRLSSLMHDLAKSISEYEFVDLSSDVSKAKLEADHFRYGSLARDKEPFSLEKAYSFTKLRTLIVCSESKYPLKEVPPVLFPTMICLRVLDLGNSDITVFPEIADDQLIHLRYLGLSNTKIKRIPSSVCKLYNLQTLELGGCANLVELPAGISKLVNLRHVGLHVDWEDITDDHSLLIPDGISHLCSLQTLSRFTVATYSDGNCNLCELENLHLRGDLCILNMEKVPLRNPDSAQKAGLKEKQYIENLMLRWSDSCHSDSEQWQHSKKVLENLQPNDRLQSLWLINYPGTRFPNWIGDTSFSSLETIRISNCNNFSFLPFLGQLPRLKNLQMSHIKEKTVESFVGFPFLENLVWFNLPFLEKLHLKYELAKLEKVSVVDCPDLRELVIHENMRGKIEHRNCPNLTETIYEPED